MTTLNEESKIKILRFCNLKKIIKEATEELETLDEVIENHLLDSQDNKLVINEFTLELRKSNTYDYESTGHPQYRAIKTLLKKWDAERKRLEAILQKIPKQGMPIKLQDGTMGMLTAPEKTNKNKIYFKQND